MTQKTYPTAVALKKGLVGVVIFGAALIVILIIHNLYQSTYRKMKTESDSKIEAVASSADMSWYQNKKIQKVDNDSLQTGSQPIQQNALLQGTPKTEDNTASQQDQQQNQDLLKAMSAPIGSNELTGDKQSNSSGVLTDMPMVQNGLAQNDSDQNMQGEKKAFIQSSSQATHDDYLESMLKNPISPYELQAGTIIPGILITGINSDLPGQITGQVRSNVYDSISGKYLLIPQGSKLSGLYDSQVAYGQERVLIVWKRIIFPNGQSINLQGMPGIDMSGYAGFNDQVNNHYGKIFGSVILMSVLGAGAQLAQPQNNANPFAAPTVGQTLAESLGTNLVNTASTLTAKNINIQPTLEIRPGYKFNIAVTKDIVFPGAYSGN